MRTFAYCRVSSVEQTVGNQVLAIRNAGYDIPNSRVISEIISGSVRALERTEFAMLVNHKLEAGDKLVVLKLDRLGRDNIDVQQTIQMLIDRRIGVISLDLPVTDLASSEGKLMLQMFSAFAEFERNRIRERTREGLERAKTEGKKLGRPRADETTRRVLVCRERNFSQSEAARELGLGIATVKRHWNREVR